MDLTDDVLDVIQRLELVLLDVDGVLTDGGLILIDEDREAKRFDVQDGMGIVLARRAGLEVGILTGRQSTVVARRADELGLEHVWQGSDEKGETLERIVEDTGWSPGEIAYMADDIQDLPVLRRVGLSIAPANARAEVRRECDVITRSAGGEGAVREALDRLLEVRGDKEALYEQVARGEL